ncbi:MAG: ABC transporter ATP-binding protein [Luteimonas sp.]
MSAISIRTLDKRFGAVHVLRGIDLEVNEGEFTVLLGPSGCGKSTLLNVIAGLEEVSSGTLHIGNEDVTDREPDKRGIAMVFQSYALYPNMTVRGNLSFGLKVARVAKDEIKRRVEWAAGLLQIEPLLERRPSQLSGGQRQRVAIGRALVRQAKVFLFDEPLSNLDAKLRTETRLEIRRLHQKLGSTIVYVTHDQVEAMTLATRIAVMNQGRVEQYAEPQELYDRPETLFVAAFVGSPAMNFLPGKLIKRDGGFAVAIGSNELALRDYVFRAPPPDGLEVVFGIRPEHVRIEAGDGALPIPHAMNEVMGADTLAWLEFEGTKFAVRAEPEQARGLSGVVPVQFQTSRCSLFARATGQRL